MPIPTITVTGTVLPPSNVSTGGSVLFELSASVVDPGAGVVVPRTVSTPILTGGAISVALWPNELGLIQTRYAVYVVMPPGAPGLDEEKTLIGYAVFPASPATQDLGDMISQSTSGVLVGPIIYPTLADAVAAAVAAGAAGADPVAATAAAERAEAAADEAQDASEAAALSAASAASAVLAALAERGLQTNAVAVPGNDWNNAVTNGIYSAVAASNAPDATFWYIGSVIAHTSGWVTQTVFNFANDAPADSLTYRRERNDGVWGPWFRLRMSEAEIFRMFGGRGSQGYLGHDDGLGSNTATAAQNKLLVVRGSLTDPDGDMRYAKSGVFIETHTDAAITSPQSVWGNAYKVGALVAEMVAHTGFRGEANGGVFRAYSDDQPVEGAPASQRILVGLSALGQTNSGAGNSSFDVWGANIIAAQTSGQPPQNVVGIEVDVVHAASSVGLFPGEFGATNYTAYWAQSDAQGGAQSDTAFLATNTAGSGGWRQILQARGKIMNWAVNLETTINEPSARGIYAKTLWGADTGRVMELWTGANEQFRVDGATDNPVWARLGGSLRKLELGAADSGGTGYKMVRVVN